MPTASELERDAEEGLSQSATARKYGVSRQYIWELAHKLKIHFVSDHARHQTTLVCPKCGAVREMSLGEAKRHKTAYCQKCHLVALGTQKKGTEASPLTKKRTDQVDEAVS